MVRQHTGIRLVLVNRELEHAQLSGVLRADDIDTLFQLLEADYGITTSPRGESEFVLRKSR
jgi:ferric-dicitrate binding protein FerR (iron transport regulator)